MARIRNSSSNNVFGGGKEQILTTDDGKSYTIKNSSVNNAYGDGKEKIIVENGSSDHALLDLIWDYLPRFITLPIEIIGYAFIFGCFIAIIYGIIQFLSFVL